MRTIMLVCSAGMSTSLLVTKMNIVATKENMDLKIFAVAEAEVKSHLDDVNVVLLGPQVRYLLPKMKKTFELREVPVDVIDSIEYGTMNGEAVLNKAISLMEE
ncbi:PTS sugar transporter subunit IIB [Sporosalibacterium faouarense]|uniref:PTS sugar transporter subunit IIB n=1 Tax=Sporosalibacterium faouarense TaxID=516123 RepID=UPI00141CCA56|nr:PTS sugar transporter subunit IIB [Sporosalibacterium faouarense]MTI47553.1 PTS sugar transporter subunit IIB [Bacillota bacterium]